MGLTVADIGFNGKENGNYYSIIKYILGLYGHNGRENGSYYLGVLGLGAEGHGFFSRELSSMRGGLFELSLDLVGLQGDKRLPPRDDPGLSQERVVDSKEIVVAVILAGFLVRASLTSLQVWADL